MKKMAYQSIKNKIYSVQMKNLNQPCIYIDTIEQQLTKMLPYLCWLYLKNNRITIIREYVAMMHFVFNDINHQKLNMFVYRDS